MLYHRIVLILLIVANILNIFFDRDGSSGNRGIIQAVNGGAFACVIFFFIRRQISTPKCYLYLKCFLLIFLTWFLVQFYCPSRYFVAGIYIKFALSTCFLFFFLKYKDDIIAHRLFQLYIVTFIIQCSVKILNGNAFAVATDIYKTMGGDIASMGLAMILPLSFLFFKGKQSFLIFVCCSVFTLFSLRRTSILAILIVTPFYWPLIKMYMSKKVIAVCLGLGSIIIVKAWNFVGAKIIVRFMEGSGSSSGMQAYGSGRSEFWGYLLDNFISKENFLFGNGLGSVYECFSKGWRIALAHAHSDFFEILYTFGIVGIVLWFLFWKGIFVIGLKTKDIETRKMILGLVILYGFIAFSSGCVLRAEFFPIVIALPILLNKAIPQK